MAQISFANLNDSFIKWNDKSAKLTGKTYTITIHTKKLRYTTLAPFTSCRFAGAFTLAPRKSFETSHFEPSTEVRICIIFFFVIIKLLYSFYGAWFNLGMHNCTPKWKFALSKIQNASWGMQNIFTRVHICTFYPLGCEFLTFKVRLEWLGVHNLTFSLNLKVICTTTSCSNRWKSIRLYVIHSYIKTTIDTFCTCF